MFFVLLQKLCQLQTFLKFLPIRLYWWLSWLNNDLEYYGSNSTTIYAWQIFCLLTVNCYGLYALLLVMLLGKVSNLFSSTPCWNAHFFKDFFKWEFLSMSLILFGERLYQLLQTTESKALREQERLSLSKDGWIGLQFLSN